MTLPQSLESYLNSIATNFKTELGVSGGYLTLSNSGQRGSVKSFQVSLESLLQAFKDIEQNITIFSNLQNYVETPWRDQGSEYFTDLTLKSLVTVQTKPVFSAISKMIAWANELPIESISDNFASITTSTVRATIIKIEELIKWYVPQDTHIATKINLGKYLPLPKPFLLLAGISGTGKTRFVREQAASHRADLSNYCLIPVRPDWHEPSDLLGYVSRMGAAHYVVTELLCFVVSAWKEAVVSASADDIQNKAPADMTPYWLCLDEMNLAPVEQYFADYLAVLETRKWDDDVYSCDPLLKADAFNKLTDNAATKMREDLKLESTEYDGLWAYFMKTGIPLPPNLIVAGTVNMDETTHGFSRKVIDRAFTIDFGAFYPNDFEHYFTPVTKAKTLGFPCLSAVSKTDLEQVESDSDGQKSIEFLNAINAVLKNTPFELAFRALNELLISLVCFNPKDDSGLQALWDDFLMTKVLPRIDGDSHKLGETETGSLLTKLATVAATQCSAIWATERPDLLQENVDATLPCNVPCRSKAKLAWMQERLVNNGFTSFWP